MPGTNGLEHGAHRHARPARVLGGLHCGLPRRSRRSQWQKRAKEHRDKRRAVQPQVQATRPGKWQEVLALVLVAVLPLLVLMLSGKRSSGAGTRG